MFLSHNQESSSLAKRPTDPLGIHWARALAQDVKVHIPQELFQQKGEGWVEK